MEDKTLQVQLDAMKSGLETLAKTEAATAATAAATKAISEMQTALETKNAELIKKAFTDNLPAIKEVLPELAEIKGLADWKITKDEADKKNQDALDELVKDVKDIKAGRIMAPQQGVSLKAAIEAALNEGDNYKNLEMLAMNHKDRNKRFTMELKLVGDMGTGNVTGGSRYGAQFAPNIIENPKRKLHIRSLVPVGSAGPGNTFTFMRENGVGEGAIAPTAETGTKPQFDLDLVETTVNFEWIAGWLRVTRKAMNNIPGFMSYLNSRLPELLLRAEDAQLISGDGVSPNISGILDTGNFTASTSTATVLIEQLIDSLAQLEDDEERDATGILLRPVDYYSFFKNKAAGSGEYDLPQNVTFANGVLFISGVPVFASTALTAGKYIVGDWEMGAQLLIQNGMRIEFFEQDGTNVRENKITVRIEESVAFPIYGDNYFIAGDVPDVS